MTLLGRPPETFAPPLWTIIRDPPREGVSALRRRLRYQKLWPAPGNCRPRHDPAATPRVPARTGASALRGVDPSAPAARSIGSGAAGAATPSAPGGRGCVRDVERSRAVNVGARGIVPIATQAGRGMARRQRVSWGRERPTRRPSAARPRDSLRFGRRSTGSSGSTPFGSRPRSAHTRSRWRRRR